MKIKTQKSIVMPLLKYAALLLMMLFIYVPIIGVVFSAFKTREEYTQTPRLMPPESFLNFDNFIEVLTKGKVLTGFLNTLLLIVTALIISVIFGTAVAYSIERFRFRGRNLIANIYLISSFIPTVTTQIIIFNMMQGARLVDTFIAPLLIYASLDVVTLTIYRQYIKEIPPSLDEAASIDGASKFKIYTKIILPILSPAMITACIMKGTAIYNDFYTAYLYLPSDKHAVLSTMLQRFRGPYGARWNVISAGIIVVVLPILVLFIIMQKRIYRGFAEGAEK